MAKSKRAGKNKRKNAIKLGEDGSTVKPKRAKLEDVVPKTHGFLIGHNLSPNSEYQVEDEAIKILEEYALKDQTKYKADGKTCRFEPKSLHSINLKKRIFIESDIDDPCTLVKDIYTGLKSKQTHEIRFCMRFQPVAVCTSELNDMIETIKPLLKSLLHQHEALKYRFNWFGLDTVKEKFCDDVREYMTSLGSHEEVLPMSNPELVIDVRLKGTFGFISVLQNYNLFSKYNIANIISNENSKNNKDNAKASNTNNEPDTKPSHQDEIRFGLRGFLISKLDYKADDDEVAAEAIKILSTYSDSSAKGYRADGGTCSFEKKPIKVDSLVFLSTDIDDPSALVHDIYTDLLTSDEPKIEEVTFCRSILPVFTCKRKYKPIVSSVKKFIKPIFVEQEEEETLKYKITCKGYFPKNLSKTNICDELTNYLTSKLAHKPCGNPDVEILIQNVGQISYISMLPNHNIFKGYNMFAIIYANKKALEEDSSSSSGEDSADSMDEGEEEEDREDKEDNESDSEDED